MHFLNGRDDVREQNINHYRRRSSPVSLGVLITSLADDFLPASGSFGHQKKNRVLLPGLRAAVAAAVVVSAPARTLDFPDRSPTGVHRLDIAIETAD